MKWKEQQLTHLKLHGMKEVTVDVDRLDEELTDRLKSHSMKLEDIESYLNKTIARRKTTGEEGPENAKQDEVSDKEMEITESNNKDEEESEKENQEKDKIDEVSESTSNNRESNSSEKEIPESCEVFDKTESERESSIEANRDERESKEKEKNNEVSDSASNSEKEIHESSEVIEKSESERGRESSMEANRDEKESQENDKIDDELSESTSNNRETYSSEKEIHDGSEFVKENSTERESSLEANKKENEGEGVEEEKMEVDDLDSVAASDESSTSSPKGSEKVGHDDSEEMSAKNSKSGSENQSDKESEDEIVNEGDEMDEKTATVDDKTLEDKSEGEKEESGTNSAKEMDIDKDVSSVEMVDKSLSEKQSEIENNDSDSSSNSAANEEDIDQNQIDSKKSSEIENDSDNSSNESDRKCSDSENTKDSLKKEPSVESQASKKNASSDSSVSEADDESEQIKSEENEVFHPKHKKLKKRSSLNKIRSQSNSDSDSDSDDSEKKDSEYSVKNASARSRSSPDDSENEVPSNNSDISVQAVDDNNDRDVKSDNSTAENESRSSPKLESITKISGSNKDSDEREISSSGNDSDSDKKSDTESGSKNIEDTDSKSNLDGNTENVENCFESKDLSYVENTKLKESTLQGQSRDSDSQHSRTQPDKIYVNGYSDKTIDAQHAMSFEGFKLKSKKPSDVTVDQIKDAVDKKPSKDILKHEASIHSDKVIVQKLLSSDRTVESVVTEKGAACEVKPDLVKKEPCKVNEIKTETEMKPLFEKFILSGALNKQNLRKNLQNIKNDIQQLQNSLNTGKKQNNVHGVSSSKLKPDNSVVDVKEHSEKVNDKKETKADNNESESSSDSTDSSPSDESTDSSSSDSDHKSDSAAVQNKDSDREFNIIDQGEKVKSEIDLIISDAIGELNENQSPTNENISIESSENSNDSVIITKISSGSSSVQSIASPDPDDDDDDDDNDDGGESDSDGETKTEDYKSARSRTDTKRTSKSSSQEMSNDSFKANNELEEWHVEVNEDYNSDDNSKPSSKEGTPVDEDSNQIKDSKSSSIDQNKLSGKDPKSKGTHHLLDYMKSKRNKKSKSDNLKTASDEGSPANVLPILDTLKNQFKVQDHSSPQTRVKYRQGSSPQKARPGRPRKGNVMYRVETAVNTSQKTPITNESQLPESSKSLAKSALSKILSQPVNVDLDTVGINAKQPTNINVKQPNVVFMNSGQFANFTSGQKPNLQVIAGGHTSTRPAMYYPRYVFMPGTNNIVPIEQFARNIPINNKRMPRLNSLLNAGRPFIRPRVVNITHPPRMPGPRPGLLPDCYMTKFNVKNMNQTQSQYLKNIMNQPLTEAEKRIRGPQKKRKRGKQKVIEIDSSGNDSDASFEKLLEDAQEEDGESELEPEDPSYDYDTLSSRIRKARNQVRIIEMSHVTRKSVSLF